MAEKWAGFAARRRGLLGDVLLAVAVIAFTIPTTVLGHAFALLPVPQWLQLAAGAGASAAMLARRRTVWPMVVTAVLCACLTGQLVPLTLAAYSMTAENKVAEWRWAAGGLTVVYAVVDYANPHTDRLIYLIAVRAVALVYLPALVGRWVRGYRQMIREIRDGVRAAEEHAAARERRRLAAELHDTVTHAVTVMVLNAGIIQETKDVGEIGKLASNIEDKGVQALTELRELLTVLRREEPPGSAEGIAAIPALVDEANATGLHVSLKVDVPEGAVSRESGHAGYRVVQEGLNNVRKHAPGSDVTIVCEVVGDLLSVAVVNTAARGGPAPRTAAVASGFGLTGLRERLTLVGGRLVAGPTRDGGFELRAWIPCHPDPAHVTPGPPADEGPSSR